MSLSNRNEISTVSFKSWLLNLRAVECVEFRQKLALHNSITVLETEISKPCFVRADSKYAYCHGRLSVVSPYAHGQGKCSLPVFIVTIKCLESER